MRALLLIVAISLLSACASVPDGLDAAREPDLAAGEALYLANCADCHGEDLRGTDKGPSQLSEVYVPSHHGDAAFLLAVRNGSRAHHWNFGDMAPVPGLTDDDIVAITSYVRSVQQREGFEPYPP